ncbi:MAG: hypothetical protein KAS11_02400 [Candidatus Aenigmarchaeota archaeon]|nr:hypothetical protein [Candidatus Aenigmarchaeota archaeon]
MEGIFDEIVLSTIDFIQTEGSVPYSINQLQNTYGLSACSIIIERDNSIGNIAYEEYLVFFKNDLIEPNGDRVGVDSFFQEDILTSAKDRAADVIGSDLESYAKMEKDERNSVFEQLTKISAFDCLLDNIKTIQEIMGEQVTLSVLKCDEEDPKNFIALEQTYYRKTNEKLFVSGDSRYDNLVPEDRGTLNCVRCLISIKKYEDLEGNRQETYNKENIDGSCELTDVLTAIPEPVIELIYEIPWIPSQIKSDFYNAYVLLKEDNS